MADSQPAKTDGSSIKPVSSLLARFENMNNGQSQSTTAAAPAPPRSPAPKPERLRSFKPSTDGPTRVPATPTKPSALKEKPPVKPKHLHTPNSLPQSARPVPQDSAILIPPPVTIQPPQSPPQDYRSSQPIRGDQSPFLDPSHATLLPRAPSPKLASATSSRPLTPTHGLPPPRSPRLPGSKPPSPPPPRRSTDARREKEARALTPATTGRSEKRVSVNLSAAFPLRQDSLPRHIPTKEASPFGSPPSSPETEDDSPPLLPSRPRPTADNAIVKHNSIVQRPQVRRSMSHNIEQSNGNALGITHKDMPAPADNDEPPPPLPVRRPTVKEQPSKRDMPPPPRPTRAPTVKHNTPKRELVPVAHSPQPPATDFLPPPARTKTKTFETKNPEKSLHLVSTSPEPPKGPPKDSSLPDVSCVNRRPPYVKKGCHEIETRYEPKRFDVCGDVVCTTGAFTRCWNTVDGEQLLSFAHTEGVKATAVIFKPGADPDSEASRVWVGMNSGDMMEIEIATSRIVCNKPGAHGRWEIIKAYRYLNEIWTLDESGCLHIWGPDEDGIPNLNKNPTQSYKVPKGHTFSLVAGGELWLADGKLIRVFEPSLDGSTTFQVLLSPIVTEGTADITSGTTMDVHPDKVFFGHVDGKVSIYSTSDYSCQRVIHVSGWKINTLAGVGADLWVGYTTGRVSIFDTTENPWMMKKEWQAHDSGIYQLKSDATAAYRMDRSQVASIGNDGMVKLWDGLLQDDRLENTLKLKENQYCQFQELSLMVMTWNAGASTPHSLRYSDGDATFFQEFVQTSGFPDILVFGFQEIVDLEDKTATAKRFLKSKKKDSSDNENMSHRYRDWRDFLLQTLDDYTPKNHLYQLLFNAPLVGLFTCVFVKSSLQGRIRNLQSAEVKRGMGGLHGNKGAIAVRFQIDDSSLCFVNCHLAAGQTQTSSRNNDIAAILEAELFPTERDGSSRQDYYRGGGDGGMIVDHEICVINGDLNYRIDTMSRDTVVKAVQQGNLGKLRDRDQLLVSRRKNPAFRLRAFEELPLTFAPTYKYDVGTDRYDTSEKRRSPAWCDRLLYRANGKIEQLDYGRHEIKVSDHRPVSGSFKLHVKNVDDRKRAQVVMEAHNAFEDVRQKHLDEAKLHYLVSTCGFDEQTSKLFIQNKAAKNRR